jgi:hypothetical protein
MNQYVSLLLTNRKSAVHLHALHSSRTALRTFALRRDQFVCETWSLTLREEHGLRVFENRVLRRIFGPKRDDVTGEWRKMHNDELHNLYSSPDIIRQVKSRRMRWAGHVARMGEERKVYKIWWESAKERDHSEDQGVGGNNGIRMDLRKISLGVCGLDSTGSGQGQTRF